MSLSIVALRGSVPTQWIMDYRATLGKYAGFGLGQRQQLKDIFEELKDPQGKQSAGGADVVTLGDAWLGPAIQQRLVVPIQNAEHSRWWRFLGPRWHTLLRRDENGMPSAKGQIYAAPYRWGATLVAYRHDRLVGRGGRPIRDWADLLQPQLKGRIAFLDSSRHLVAIALKSLGLSANTRAGDLAPRGTAAGAGVTAEVLAERVDALRGQALLFSSRDHIRALSAGDAWVAVGSSQDLIGISQRMSSVQLVAPASGCPLTADLWAVPAGAKGGSRGVGPSPLLPSWLEFGLAPARGSQHAGLRMGAAPHILPEPQLYGVATTTGTSARSDGASAEMEDGIIDVTHDNGYLPGRTVLQRSEFLFPLDAATLDLYRSLILHSS